MSLRLALLGDSIAWGQGAAREDERLAPRLADGLAATGVATVTRAVAVPGSRSEHLADQVDALLPWAPDLVVVVIGANDLTHRTPAGAAAADLARAVRRLRDGGAEVVVAPAPDLSAVPLVPADLRPSVRRASEHLRALQVDAVHVEGGHVADADGRTAAAFHDDPALFSADRFHPSSAGYAVIAAGLLPEVVRVVTARCALPTPVREG